MANIRADVIDDFSGAVQKTSSRFKRGPNEVDLAVNTDFRRIGGIGTRKGYTQKGGTLSTTTSTSSTTTSTSSSTTSSTSSSTSTS